jgi:hypothetical protein
VISAIQHVATPERVENVRTLVEALQPLTEATVVVDDVERRGPQWSWRETLRAAGQERLFALQDDVSIAAPASVIEDLIALRPDDILCLCYPRAKAAELVQKGYRWVSLRGTWTYGTIYPPGLAAEIVAWADKHIPAEYRPCDRSLSAFMNHHALIAYAPIPSVTQHLTFKSTIGHGNLPHKREAPVLWSEGIDYSPLAAWPHPSHRRTVAEIKASLQKRKPA